MQVEQFVMAYYAEQDRLRVLLPEGFVSLRPVLRINAEVRDGVQGYVEFNTAVTKEGKTTLFAAGALRISFTGVGVEGGCPAEKDNAGCWFSGAAETLRPPETIAARKEFCGCQFQWRFTGADAHGASLGKTLPAVPEDVKTVYPKQPLTAPNAAAIPCAQVLGTCRATFERQM